MTAPTTKIFGPLAANFIADDEVAQQHARQWVPDYFQGGLRFNEGMPALTSVLDGFRSPGNHVDAMAKEAASIVHSFLKFAVAGVWITSYLEQQGVSALSANVLMVTFARGNRGVFMLAKETGQRMGDARNALAPIKYRSSTASARRVSIPGDYCVMDLVAKERACA